MRKISKRFSAMLLIISLIIMSAGTTYATDMTTTNVKDAALQMAFPSGTDLIFEERSLSDNINPNSITPMEKVIVSERQEGEEIIVTTIIPYTLVNGELVNSYIVENNNPSARLTSEFVDVTVVSEYSYRQMFSILNAENYYRTTSVYAYWNSDNSTVSVDNMNVTFEIYGHRYTDDVETVAEDSCLVEEDYSGSMAINRNSPVEGTHYSAAKTLPSSGYVCGFKNYMGGHGLFTYIKLTYSVNGNQRTDDRSYYLVS